MQVLALQSNLTEKLCVLADLVRNKDVLAKEKMKGYDRKAVSREFDVGTMVLVRTPDL